MASVGGQIEILKSGGGEELTERLLFACRRKGSEKALSEGRAF